MRLRTFSALVVAALAVAAATASVAAAGAVTERAEWYVEDPAVKTLVSPTPIHTKVVAHTGEFGKKFTLKAGGADLTATELECVECTAENKAATGKEGTIATGSGRLKFKNVTVDEPANCAVAGGAILTEPLTFHADWMHEGKAFWHFFPTVGNLWLEFELVGALCPLAGIKVPVTGDAYGELKPGTGFFAEELEVEFSPALQVTAGAELKSGKKIAELTGTAAFSLTKEAGVLVKFANKP